MKKIKQLFFFLSVAGLLLMAACDDYDRWTTSPSALLSFSADSIRFDTIIAGQSSSTQTLIVFNNAKDGLRNISVRLKDGAKSRFRVNVDGRYLAGGMGDDFEIRQQDSLVVRAEVLLPEGGDSTIRHYEDCLVFTLESGISQQVVLTADGMDVRILRAKVVTGDETLTAEMPYQVYDSLVVAEGATLTLEAGTRLLFHDGVSLHVRGTLVAKGTADSPIVFRGDRMDKMFPYLPYDRTPNRWGGVHIHSESLGNVFDYCDLHGGDYGIKCDSAAVLDQSCPTLTLSRSIVHNFGGHGLQLRNVLAQITACQISNTLGRCVEIVGGGVEMANCTVAQFYPFDAERQEALYLANVDDEENYVHLYYAYFLNSVITGYADDVIMGKISEGQDYTCDYLFINCLLRTVESEDKERFRNVVYDNKDLEPLNYHDHFVLFDTHNFLYDFSPWSNSAIATLGDADIADIYCLTDLRGKPFVEKEGKVVCGALNAVEKEEESEKENP